LYKVLEAKDIDTPRSFGYPEPPLTGREKLNRFWDLLVNEYTARECTNPKDKIRAFGGVAAEFQRLFPQDRYLAGLWWDTLLVDLLWVVNGDIPGDQDRSGIVRHRGHGPLSTPQF